VAQVACFAEEAVGALHVAEAELGLGEGGDGGARAVVEDPDAQVSVIELRDVGVGVFEDFKRFVAAGKEDVSAGSEMGRKNKRVVVATRRARPLGSRHSCREFVCGC
jgi:hypothetical protein